MVGRFDTYTNKLERIDGDSCVHDGQTGESNVFDYVQAVELHRVLHHQRG